MQGQIDPCGERPPSDILVRQFRQILLWPVQLAPVEDHLGAAAHWERLPLADCSWQEVVDGNMSVGSSGHERRYAEFVAFMPDVQRFLYGEGEAACAQSGYGGAPIRIFHRADVAGMRVVLQPGEPAIDFAVARVELHFFYDIDLAILAIEIVGADLTLEQAEDALFRLGRAYPTSWDGERHGKDCCESVALLDADGQLLAASDYASKERYLAFFREHRTPCVAAHWAFLLHPLMPQHGGEGAILYRQLEHQRFPFLAFLAVDDPYRIARDDWMRLGLASPPGPPGTSPFAADFLAGFEARYCYDRFWDPAGRHDQTATRILCSGRAFVMVGEAGSALFIDAETGVLALFRYQYFQLALIAHFHRAALLIFRDRLVSAISQLRDYASETVKRFKREIRLTHENFLRFTHRYWFRDVSNQAPAQDLFDRWVSELATDRLFAEVRDEVRDMMEYLDSDSLRRQANMVVRLTVVTFFGLIGTVVTGFLGMNLIDLTEVSLIEKTVTLTAVSIPVAALTFYTAAKSQRLAEFLDAVSDERQTVARKVQAFMRVWRRRSRRG